MAVVLAQDLHAELVVSADNVSRNVFADSAGAGHHESLVPGLVSQLPLQEDPEILPVVQMNGVVVGMISADMKNKLRKFGAVKLIKNCFKFEESFSPVFH